MRRKSKKSVSKSGQRRKLLKRAASIQPLADHHLPYMWAAYRRGLFSEIFDDGLTSPEFVTEVSRRLMAMHASMSSLSVLVAQTEKGMIPVGIMTSVPFHSRNWVHAIWFPEASPRNRLELAVRAFHEGTSMATLVAPENVQFFARVCQYGVLRPVGKFRRLFLEGGDAMIYESV